MASSSHFQTLEQEHDAARLGMWIFLATEALLFGGLFTAYTFYRTVYPMGFAEGSRHLDLVLASINTLVLLFSSLLLSLAANRTRPRPVLVITALLGLVFLALKGVEYQHHFTEGLVPGLAWKYSGPMANEVQLFMFAYFVMTGLHALHLSVGVGLVGWLVFANHGPMAVEVSSLYWHFVDVIWLFVFTLLYWNSSLAVAVAGVLALLIATFLMGLHRGAALPRLVSIATVLWLGFLIVGTLDDVLTRGWLPVPGK